ncbi:hypothetical protein LguiA_023279 [Lonicera macranthoides]
MSILSQPSHTLRPSRHASERRYRLSIPTAIYCSTTTTKPSPVTEPLLIQPQLLVTPVTRPVLDDQILQSSWSHKAWLTTGCTTVLATLANSITNATGSQMWLEPILASLVGYVLADLGSGVYHWAIDNYGDTSTPIFGSQIEAFQGHHKWPWTITKRAFANNLHALARATTFVVLPIDLISHDSTLLGFVGVCSGCIMFSQQFHAWAHGTKSKLPPLVVALQDSGILVSRLQHSAHHRPPYNNNYCIVSGLWNEFLDKNKVFEALEMILFFKIGLRPRSWTEPNSEWIAETENPAQIELQ